MKFFSTTAQISTSMVPEGTIPLHCRAAKINKISASKMLIKKDAQVTAQDYYSNIQPHSACDINAIGMVQLLVDIGTEVNVKNKNSKTQIPYAIDRGNT